MRSVTLFLSSILLLACLTRAYARANVVAKLDPLILTDEQDSYPLGLHIELLEDPGGELTIEDVTSAAYDPLFVPSQVDVPNFGFTDSAIWARIHLRNETPGSDHWLLEVGFANMHFVDLYTPLPDGSGFDAKQTGILRALETRDLLHPHIIFDLTIPPQEQQAYYLRFQSGASMTLPLTLWAQDAFFIASQKKQILLGIYFGILLGLLFYNLFLLYSLRERIYLYLAIFITSVVIFETSYAGYAPLYVFPNHLNLNTSYAGLSFSLWFLCMILFADTFLELRLRLPKLHRISMALEVIWLVLMLLTPFVSYHVLALAIPPWGVVSMGSVLAAGIISWQRGNRSARFFLVAWFGLISTVLLIILVRFSLINSNLFTENAYRFGIIWMAVCWSIALADRINLLKAETESASRNLKQSEDRLTQTLEAMPVGVVVYGPDQKPTFVNRRSIEILTNAPQGIVPDLSAGRTLAQAMSYYTFRKAGSDQAYPLEDMPVHRALQGEHAAADDIEADLIDKRVPLEIWASPLIDNTGKVDSAVVAFQDITKRKQSEMALRASEMRFRAIVENNFDGISFLDRDRKILYVSPSYKQLNGLSAAEMIGKSGVETVHPDDQTRVAEAFQKLLQTPGERVSEEYRIRHRDGSWVWVETRVMNLLDDPNVRAVVLNSRNITERKKAEAELANHRYHLKQLVVERTEELKAINEQLTVEMAERAVLEGLLYKRIQWMSDLALARQIIKGTADLPAAYEQLSLALVQLLDAGSLFLLQWQEGGKQVEFRCRPMPQGTEVDPEAIRNSFEENAALRQKLEPREIVVLSDDEVKTLPEPLCACLLGPSIQSLLLAPMVAGKAVMGVLGMTLFLPGQALSAAQGELITKITLDLTALAQEARFLDQARTLVASEERNLLARDLHDSVTQVLFSASLVAEVLPQIWRRDAARGMQSLEELRRLTRGALAEMRTMLLELRPAAAANAPLAELLTQLTEASTSRTALPFHLFIEKMPVLPEKVHATFYRIAQEALNNVAKHAQASQVTVSLSAVPLGYDPAGLTRYEVKLVIEDDGLGFSAQNERLEHLGLGIMRERAADIQASVVIDSEIDQGTRLTLIWCGAGEGSS